MRTSRYHHLLNLTFSGMIQCTGLLGRNRSLWLTSMRSLRTSAASAILKHSSLFTEGHDVKSSSRLVLENAPLHPFLFSSHSFLDLPLHAGILNWLQGLGFRQATAIQAASFVPVSAGKDVTIQAEPGVGKTIAYLLPLLNRMLFQDIDQRAVVYILVPNETLVKQVLAVFSGIPEIRLQELGEPIVESDTKEQPAKWLRSTRIHHGAVDFVVGTPFRFLSEIESTRSPAVPGALVFDEADFLIGGCQRGEIVQLLQKFGIRGGLKSRSDPSSIRPQFIFVSATLPSLGPSTPARFIYRTFPNCVPISTVHTHGLPPGITAEWISLKTDDQAKESNKSAIFDARLQVLAAEILPPLLCQNKKVLVFVNSRRGVGRVVSFLKEKGWPVGTANDSNCQVLVGTDLVGRGVDWKNINVVVNLEMPGDVVSWLHRAGRVGRMGSKGLVVSLVPEDGKHELSSERKLAEQVKLRLTGNFSFESLFSARRSLSSNRRLRNVDSEVKQEAGSDDALRGSRESSAGSSSAGSSSGRSPRNSSEPQIEPKYIETKKSFIRKESLSKEQLLATEWKPRESSIDIPTGGAKTVEHRGSAVKSMLKKRG